MTGIIEETDSNAFQSMHLETISLPKKERKVFLFNLINGPFEIMKNVIIGVSPTLVEESCNKCNRPSFYIIEINLKCTRVFCTDKNGYTSSNSSITRLDLHCYILTLNAY